VKYLVDASVLSEPSLVSWSIAVYPIVDGVGKEAYATKIASVVLPANAAGVPIYRAGERRRTAS
jgi:hypothetical protein